MANKTVLLKAIALVFGLPDDRSVALNHIEIFRLDRTSDYVKQNLIFANGDWANGDWVDVTVGLGLA